MIIDKIRNWICADIIQENNNLKSDLNKCSNEINSLTKSNIEKINQVIDLKNKITALENINLNLIKHVKGESINEFKIWFDLNIKPTVKTHPFNGPSQACHLHYHHFSQNKKLVDKYYAFVNSIANIKPKNADDLIYSLNVVLDDYIDSFKKPYQTDVDVFGVQEKWLDPETIYDYYVNKKIAIDCDDTGTFKYCCLVSALINCGLEKEIWRLKTLIVSLTSGQGVHYLLSWLKSESDACKGWIALETTYRKDLFRKVWMNNIQIRDNMMYEILFSFDEIAEYERLQN